VKCERLLIWNGERFACEWWKIPSIEESVFWGWEEVLSNTKKKALEVLYTWKYMLLNESYS
jgi:hypothetical protein